MPFSFDLSKTFGGKALLGLGDFLSGAANNLKKFNNAPSTPYGVAGYTPGAPAPLPAKQAVSAPLNANPPSTPIINVHSTAPIVDNSGHMSNVRTSTDATAAHIAQVQAQVAANLAAGKDINGNPVQTGAKTPEQIAQETGQTAPQYDANGNVTPSAKPSTFDKLINLFKTGQDKINGLPPVASLQDTTNQILSQFGYTPETFKQVADLNNQLTSLNNQINTLETAKATELSNATGVAGQSGDFANGEAGRINRKYAIQEASLGAKSSIITAQISALQGAWDKAESAAKDYVTLATTQQRQLVSDIQYSMNYYKDVFTAMDSSDQKRMNDLLTYQTNVLKQQTIDAQNQLDNSFKQQGIDIQKLALAEKTQNDQTQNAIALQKVEGKGGGAINPNTGYALPDLNETKNKDLNNANKLVLDAQKMIDLMKKDPTITTRSLVPFIGAFQTDAGEFKAAYNAILHTYASEISTQLLRTSSNQDTIKSLLPKLTNSTTANINNLQGLIDKANGLMNGIDPTGGYRTSFGYNVNGGSQPPATSQVMYQGKKYNVDASGNMTLAQ